MSWRRELENYMDGLDIIDTHEHLPMSHRHRKRDTDFFTEYCPCYIAMDFFAAGMDPHVFETKVLNQSLSIMERWDLVEPYWEKIRFTGHTQFVDNTVRELYGLDGVNRETVEEIDHFIKAGMEKDWHEEILKKKCRIETALLHTPYNWVGIPNMEECFTEADPRYFSVVADLAPYLELYSVQNLQDLAQNYGKEIECLEDLQDAMEKYMYRAAAAGAVGFKSNIAYHRTLKFEKAGREEAEKCFAQVLADKDQTHQRPESTNIILGNYMMHSALAVMEDLKLPFQIHTGLNGPRNMTEANPSLLNPLFMEYKGVKFDIFHMGYPYQHELSGLAKMFSNVYIDMCWGHVLSPPAGIRALSEWLETIPYSKILGFGGDSAYLDGVVGNRRMAIRNIAVALEEKINNGLMNSRQAMMVAKALLHDNPAELYELN